MGKRRMNASQEAEDSRNMDEIRINDKISYIECGERPLSSDIGIIKEGKDTWLYDVGNGADRIAGLSGQYHIVLSHFHPDHVGNLNRIGKKEVYVSAATQKYVRQGTIVTQDLYIGGLHLFLLPSSHAKGCLGLEVDETYAFVGDALYCKAKLGYGVYNAQLLKEQIEVLKRLKAPWLLLSHRKNMVQKKDLLIEWLENIYDGREKGNPEIRIELRSLW